MTLLVLHASALPPLIYVINKCLKGYIIFGPVAIKTLPILTIAVNKNVPLNLVSVYNGLISSQSKKGKINNSANERV